MKIKEYINAVTAKIFATKEREAVSLELEDHIKCNKSFYEEIGYDDEISEDKAVDEMGAADEISSYITTLHNDLYNPIFDLIGFGVWAFALIASYMFLRNLVFNDVTAAPISIGYNVMIIGMWFGLSAINVKRNRKMPLLLTFALGIVTIAILSLVNLTINSNGINSVSRLKEIMFNGIIPSASRVNIPMVLEISAVLFAIMLVVFIFNLVLVNKYEKLENTLKTNHTKKAFKNTLSVICAVLLIASLLFVADIFVVQSKIKEQYINDYKTAFAIVDGCEAKDDVLDYLKNNKIDYSTQGSEKISLQSNIADIVIDFKVDNQIGKTDDPVVNLFGKMLKGYLDNRYPLTLANKNDYILTFSIKDKSSNVYAGEGERYLGYAKLTTKPSDLDELFDFETKENTTNQDLVDVFGGAFPTTVTINASNDHIVHASDISFEYTAGNGKNAFDQVFDEHLKSNNEITVLKQQNLVMDTINANPKISNDELAKVVGAKRTKPELSFVDHKKLVGYLADNDLAKLSDKELKETYNKLYAFVFSDDLMFYRIDAEEKNKESYIIFDSKTKFDYVNILDYGKKAKKDGEYSSFYASSFRKIICNGVGYYDINGNAYKDYMNVAYYSKDGERFRYFEDTDEDGKLIEKYFIGSKGSKCIANDGYVTLDGYFVCGDDSFKKDTGFSDSDIYHYHDKNNVEYIKAQEASWDSRGNLLEFEEHFNINK